MSQSTVAELQDAVACAVTTALRDSGYSLESEDEADFIRCAFIIKLHNYIITPPWKILNYAGYLQGVNFSWILRFLLEIITS